MARIKDTDEAWEDRTLGADAANVGVAGAEHEDALDDALDLQLISIRLPKQLVKQYKLIAHFHDVGYQPLMRDVLARWVPNELGKILEAERKKATDASPDAGGKRAA